MLFLQNLFLSSMLLIDTTALALILPRQNINPVPVLGDSFIHDPTVVKTPGGSYIASYTGDNVQLKTSSDRKNWRNAGAAFPGGAPWTTLYTKGDKNLWAPDISYHNGQYWMYYSASSFGSSVSAIFLATSATGASGSWTNQGLVVESNAQSNFNAIDPNLIIDASGNWWMTFGSFWSGIKLVKLDAKTGKRSDNNILSIASRPANGGAIEAPFIFRRGDYYYLWASFDLCCKGAASTYRIMVGRSKSITGPYLDKSGKDMMQGGGTQMMASHGSIHGPGHNAVIADSDGDVLFYHYYMDNGVAQIGIDFLRYDDDWPTIVASPAGPPPATTSVRPTTTAVRTTTAATVRPTTTVVSVKTTSAVKTTTAASGGGQVPLYGQCGGAGWTGPTQCAAGTCKVSNQWYSQCLN